MTLPVDHIVFDIGRVLIHYDPDIPFSRIIPDPVERKWFFDTVCTHDWNMEQDRGRTWADAEALLIASHPDQEERIRAFRKHWHEMVSHAYDDSVALMKRFIDEGRDVTMLTNFADDTFDQAQEIFRFLTLPRGVTVSARVGLIKPDPEIYRVHTERFGLTPERTLFIDDSLPNIEAARRFGWQAVHYTGAEKLRADLAAHGLL
jgi:2-haloacid dehalogenase